MSLEELQQMGILLPKDKWRKRKIKSRVPRVPLAIVGALFPVSALLMYFGDGGAVSWAGVGLFLVLLGAFTALNLKGIFKR
ncbi:MAG: hypothetical protein O6952_04130 [Planctomycetota bacterium]|nr:hypothetical protein [Planctomycetota bacterium]